MITIAVIEDNVLTGDMISDILTGEGFHVLRAYSGTEALYLLKQTRPDLILLDLILPGLDGEGVLEHIKGIPVIILSSKTEVEHKIHLLNEGACDYITKPFHQKELIARILVQLRKDKTPRKQADESLLSVGDLTLDPLSMELLRQSQTVRLTRTECTILKLLMMNPKKPVSRSSILDKISLDTPDCTERSLKQHVSNLRRKLMDAGAPDCIETVWGIGFRLRDAES